MLYNIRQSKLIFKIFLTIIYLFIFFILSSIIVVNIFCYYYGINADIASEGILAKLIWDTKEWIPASWYVSTETRIFNVPNLAALLYGITGNITLSVGLSCCFFSFGILGSIFLFAKAIGFDKIQISILLLLCLILPNNSMIVELLYIHAAYYAPHTILLFITLAVYVSAKRKKRVNISAGIIVLLHVLYGTQGVRGILIISGPLFAVELLCFLYQIYIKKIHNYDWKLFIWSIALVAGGFIGGLFPYSVEQSLSRNIRNAPEKLINYVFPDILKAIGIQDAGKAEKIIIVFLVICTVIVSANLFIKMIRKKEIEAGEWGSMVIILSPIMTVGMLTFTTVESSGRYYFVFLFAFALCLVTLWKYNNRWLRVFILCLVVSISILNYKRLYVPIFNSGGLEEDHRYQVVEYLEQEGYTVAYSDFENANVMMLMAENNIIVGAIDDFSKMNCLKWMTSTDWYPPAIPLESKTAYIVTETKLEKFLFFCEENNAQVVEETKIGKYYIYGSDYNYTYID